MLLCLSGSGVRDPIKILAASGRPRSVDTTGTENKSRSTDSAGVPRLKAKRDAGIPGIPLSNLEASEPY